MSREAVAIILTEYAKTHVDTVVSEYSYWVGQWQNYLDLVADAHTKALDKVQNRFTKIRLEEQEAREACMMAFSVIGIVGAAWLGAMVEQVWYPKLAGKVEYFDKIERDVFGRNIWRFGQKVEFNEVIAKTVGDSIHELTGHMLDKLFESLMPVSKAEMSTNELGNNIRTARLESFKSSLDIALRNQSGEITAQLAVLKESISQHDDFGKSVLQLVERTTPRGVKLDDENMKVKGKLLLDDYFDALRQTYAKHWFYYGNVPNPARIPLLAFNVEIQAWAFWLLDQKWKSVHYEVSGPDDASIDIYAYSNGEFELGQIMNALKNLAAEEVWDLWGGGETTGWGEELDASKKLSAATEQGNWRSSEDVDKDKKRILVWARGVPGQIEHPTLDYRPRTLGNIRGMKGIFPGIQINR